MSYLESKRGTTMKVIVFGTGDISHVFMESLESFKDLVVIGVYHRDISKAKKFAKRYDIQYSFDDVDEALACDSDVIYNALPNSFHYLISLQAIKANKHVIIEKPITSNIFELKELISCADSKGVKVFEVNRINYNELAIRIKDEIHKIYPVRLTNVTYCKVSRKYKQYLNGDIPNVFSLDYSGGALYDLGVYGIHLAIFLFGTPNDVEYRCVKLASGADGCGSLTLGYNEHLLTISISKISNGNCFVEIQGEGGTIVSKYPPTLMADFNIQTFNEDVLIRQHSLEGSFKRFIDRCLSIIKSNNEIEYRELLVQSLNVMDILTKARASASITFSSD